MIFDPEIELKNIEEQPEWIGVTNKIAQLKKDREELLKKYERFQNPSILNAALKIDDDLSLFESILAFWAQNYQKMERLYKSFEASIGEVNKGAKQLDLICDLRIAYEYERKENIILSETFIELAEKKGMETEKMNEALNKLRYLVRDYLKHMNKLLNE